MKKILLCCILFFFSLLINSSFIPENSARDSVDETKALEAISESESIITSAYVAVLESKHQGADVKDLLSKLNSAGDLMSKGKNYYRLGNLTGAIYFANLSFQAATDVKIEAQKLGAESLAKKNQIFWITITTTATYIGTVAFASSYGWHIFKKHYMKKSKDET